jgi:glutathione S-transferase
MPTSHHAARAHDLVLYAHPFSSYCQKVLVALYENGTPFEWRLLSQDNPRVLEDFAALWPLKRFPVLVDGAHTVIEASIIIEYLDLHRPGSRRLVPTDAQAALDADDGSLLRQLYLDATAENRGRQPSARSRARQPWCR